MIHLRSRTVKRHPHRLDWGPPVDPDATSGKAQRRAPSRARAHKQKIMDLLIEYPNGLGVIQLGELMGLSVERLSVLLLELQAEDLVCGLGRPGQRKRWIANV